MLGRPWMWEEVSRATRAAAKGVLWRAMGTSHVPGASQSRGNASLRRETRGGGAPRRSSEGEQGALGGGWGVGTAGPTLISSTARSHRSRLRPMPWAEDARHRWGMRWRLGAPGLTSCPCIIAREVMMLSQGTALVNTCVCGCALCTVPLCIERLSDTLSLTDHETTAHRRAHRNGTRLETASCGLAVCAPLHHPVHHPCVGYCMHSSNALLLYADLFRMYLFIYAED